MRLTIHFNAVIPLSEIEQALHSRGIVVRPDGVGRLLADPAPAFLTKHDFGKMRQQEAEKNVVGLRKRTRG